MRNPVNKKYQEYISLAAWIATFLLIGSVMGFLTKTEINTWYGTLHRSPITPPNYVFPIAWTILYTLIATCGWIIWRTPSFSSLSLVKSFFVFQLILNWSWTPLFFHYHLIGLSLLCLAIMDIAVLSIIYLSFSKIKWVSFLMTIYFLWLLFATYLNFYIWHGTA